jgi:hypothetical protein
VVAVVVVAFVGCGGELFEVAASMMTVRVEVALLVSTRPGVESVGS